MCDNAEYQVSFPAIFGGPTGDYSITPPINGPCEMKIMAVSTGGAAGGAAFITQTALAEAMSAIATQGKAGNLGTPGIYIDGNSPYSFNSDWFPIDGPLSLQVAANSTGILVTCLFRKRKTQTQSQHLAGIYDSPEPAAAVSSTSGRGTIGMRGSRQSPDGR